MRVRPLAAIAFTAATFAVLAAIAIDIASSSASPGADSPGQGQQTKASSEGVDPDVIDVPAPVRPAFVPGEPVLLRTSSHVSRWAVVRSETRPRAAPTSSARALPLLSARTPEGTSNIVLALGRRVDAAGRLWVKVLLPALEPRDAIGWVPRDVLGGYGTVNTRLVVDLDSLEATLLRNGRAIFRTPVGVGKGQWPTPRGAFYIRNRLTGYTSSAYGPIAFGTSARSKVLTEWPAGGFVGIHGTDEPELLPGYVSHGCIRMRNDEILRLAKLMPVGTPLTIE